MLLCLPEAADFELYSSSIHNEHNPEIASIQKLTQTQPLSFPQDDGKWQWLYPENEKL